MKTILEKLEELHRLVSVSTIAKLLGMSRQAIYEQVWKGSLTPVRIGTAVRLDPAIVARWLAKRGAVR